VDQREVCSNFGNIEYINEALTDAENLLKFASEQGKEVDNETRDSILHARATLQSGLDEQTVSRLLLSLSKLSVVVSPVTAESLSECRQMLKQHRPYQIPAMLLAAIVVVYSIASFVASAIADSLRNDIATANALAVKLASELPQIPNTEKKLAVAEEASADVHKMGMSGGVKSGVTEGSAISETGSSLSSSSLPSGLSRADVIKDLQQYAICIRNIDAHALELSLYTHPIERWLHPQRLDPFYEIRQNTESMRAEFELQVPILDYARAATDRTRSYQKVRCFAQTMVDEVSFYYGAVSSCILPVLYALLGAAAYLLRNFEQRVSERTYVPAPASDSARFLVAAIGGAVVGLFSNVTGGEGVKVPPLAFAFLVGYAVDVFYAFLEGLIQSFTRSVIRKDTATPTPHEASSESNVKPP
jgi:hypothetical protein